MFKQFIFLLFLLSFSIQAQIPEEATPMRVVQCSAVSSNASVRNIYTDDTNLKWVASSSGVFKVFSADNATKELVPPNSWSLVRFNGGNEVLHIDRFQMSSFLQPNIEERNEEDRVTTAFLDKKKKELWVGTSHSGLFQLSVRSELRLINHYTTENSKLKSNTINTILIDKFGRQWIGTEKGVLFGEEGKFKLYEKRDKIIAVTAFGPDIWILSDQLLWQVNPENRWLKGDVDSRFAEGKIRDIEYDSEGRLWVASDIIVRYDVVNDKVERFTKANGFTSNEINVITIDQEDALWVGTEDKGLFLIEKETTMTISCSIEKGLSCAGNKKDASLSVKVIGGTPPFKYKWNNRQTTANPDKLGPGQYQVTVTDSKGLKRVAKAQIDEVKIIGQVTINAEASAFDKEDGSASIEVTGGVPDYKYRWDNGETGAAANRLSPGKHTLTVTDKMGCYSVINVDTPEIAEPEEEVVEEEVVEEEIETPVAAEPVVAVAEETVAPALEPVAEEEPREVLAPIQISISPVQLKCANDVAESVPVKVNGGKAPYQYAWSDASLKGNKIKAGSYSVTVQDDAGNSASVTFEVIAPQPLMIALQEESPVSQKGKRDGVAVAAGKGGTGKYLWLWDNGEQRARAKKLTLGKHSVTLTDTNGCETSASISISEKAVPELTLNRISSGQTIQLKKLYFQSDSTNIEPPSIPTLNEVFKFLNENKKVVVEVGGHTNDIPSHTFCDRLSKARAKAVAEYLVAKGIADSRVVYKGYGKRKPISSNRTKEGRAKNQRVELKILSLGD